MATQRYISTSFWDDAWIHRLDPSEKLLFLYLMTNPLTNIAGIYKVSIERMIFDTGFNEATVRHILSKFEIARKVFIFNEHVVVRSWPKHQQWEVRSKIKLAIIAVLQQISRDVLDFASAMDYEFPLELVDTTIIGHLARKGISGSQKKRIIERDGGKCVKCSSNKELHIHHKVHVANGGDNSDSNLETLCSLCHIAIHKNVPISYKDVRNYSDLDSDRDLDSDTNVGSGPNPKQPRSKAPAVNDPLLRPILDSFLSEGNFANYQKETVCAKAIIKSVRNLSPDNPEKAAELLLVTFRQLVHGTDKFWSGQPFLPSGLSPLVERVWAEAIKTHRVQDTGWLERLRNGQS